MGFSGSIHIHEGDLVAFERGTTNPSICWVRIDGLSIFANSSDLRRLRSALDEMIEAKTPIAEAA